MKFPKETEGEILSPPDFRRKSMERTAEVAKQPRLRAMRGANEGQAFGETEIAKQLESTQKIDLNERHSEAR